MLPQAQLEIFKNLFRSIAEEMGVVLQRSAYSPNIKERLDFSCALFDPSGELVAQAAHIPVHLGSMPAAVKAAADSFPELEEGDVVLLNDPYRGGTHLPDITAVTPAYFQGRLVGYVANRAHHADVGGAFPGSMGLARDVFQEGIRIPPVRLYRRGALQRDVMELLLANVRVPEERRGDLEAQVAANRRGAARLAELAAKYGPETAEAWMRELLDYTERMTRALIASLPRGSYTFADCIEDDGLGSGPLPIRVRVDLLGDRAVVDFTGTAPQTAGPLNCPKAVTVSAVAYVFRCLTDPETPANAGAFRAFEVVVPEGTLLHARPPAPVAGGNVETSQRVVDVVLGALAQAAPGRIPAASCGTMNNVVVGGYDPRRGSAFTYYETLGGGMGAHARGPGLSAVQTHMTNTKNTPVEALEHAYPLRVRRYCIRTGSGGRGAYSGGDGLVRALEALVPCKAALLTERRITRPYGLAGGEPGTPGENLLWPAGAQAPISLPGKVEVELNPGDILEIRTPGGGGYGRAAERP
ncbi:MAG: hydantoinase B/oxoprolinase family protein [Bacillota bacterium]